MLLNKNVSILLILILATIYFSCRNTSYADNNDAKEKEIKLKTKMLKEDDILRIREKVPEGYYTIKKSFITLFEKKCESYNCKLAVNQNIFEEERVAPTNPEKKEHQLKLINHPGFFLVYEINKDNKKFVFEIKNVWHSNCPCIKDKHPKFDEMDALHDIERLELTNIINSCKNCYEVQAFHKKSKFDLPKIASHKNDMRFWFRFRHPVRKEERDAAIMLMNYAHTCMVKAIDEYYKQREKKESPDKQDNPDKGNLPDKNETGPDKTKKE